MAAAPQRHLARLCGTAAIIAALFGASTGTARAHDELIDSSPGVDEHLDAAPSQVRLTFSDNILTIGPKVVVADRVDGTWTTGEPVLDGSSVVVTLKDDVPDGRYEIRWRVVSSDGHPITGLIPFTVGEVGDLVAPSGPTPQATSAPALEAEAQVDETARAGSWTRPALVGALGAGVALSAFWGVSAHRVRRTRGTTRSTSSTT